MTDRQRRWILLLVALNLIVLLLVVPAYLSRRAALRQLLAEWTGEEDTSYQLRALALLGLSLVQAPPDTADYVPVPYTDVPPFGVNTFFEQEVEEAKIRAGMELLRDAGFHFIRQEFPWEDLEKSRKGEFYDARFGHSTWDKYDRIVTLAHEYGLELIVRLDHPPDWTRADGAARGNFAPPDRFEDYGDFVAAVVARYRGRVQYYQIWNEPNVFPEWGDQPVDAAAYTRLLKIAYARVKAADPAAVVISAGLAQTIETGPRNVSDLIFLEQMYAAGARNAFDILAVMNYGLFTGPGDRRADPSRTNFSRPILTREIMVKHGDANKPMWAMEVGWNALPTTFESAPFGRVTLEQQAAYATQAYARAQAEWPWMGVMNYWFFKRAYDNERGQPFYYFRLFDPDFTPQPVYAALKEYIATARWLGKGYHQETDWVLEYVGPWTSGSYGPAIVQNYVSGAPGATLAFHFHGNEVALALAPNPYAGRVQAQLDGGEWADYDLRATDPAGGRELALASGLRPGAHQLTLRVTAGQLALDGIVVRTSSSWLVMPLAGVLALGCLAAGLGVWRWRK